ncbi:MAG: GNAT family N-acetyltransferase [Acidimicrobiales bacterium]
MSEDVVIEEAREASAALLADLNALVPQLSSSAPPLTAAALTELLAREGTTVFLARLGERAVGTLTLVEFAIPTGRRAWIEDVVVDVAARQRGVADQLTRAALARAAAHGARQVDLTSRPSREAANALYQKLGFVRRDTNVYRFFIESSANTSSNKV